MHPARAGAERMGRALWAHDTLLVMDVIQAMGNSADGVEAGTVDVAARPDTNGWLLKALVFYTSDRAQERLDQPGRLDQRSNRRTTSDFGKEWTGALAWETGTGPQHSCGLEASRFLVETGVEGWPGNSSPTIFYEPYKDDYQVIQFSPSV